MDNSNSRNPYFAKEFLREALRPSCLFPVGKDKAKGEGTRQGSFSEREVQRISPIESSRGWQRKPLEVRLPSRPVEGSGGARLLATEGGVVHDPEQ